MPVYTCICLSDAVHSIRSLYKLLSGYQDRLIQNTIKHLRFAKKGLFFAKIMMPKCRCTSKPFSGQARFCRTTALQKHFIKNKRKNDGHNRGLFFQNQDTFFRFSKKGREGIPFPLQSTCECG